MIFWYFCALIWFKNIEKMLLQMTSGFLQLESTLSLTKFDNTILIFCSMEESATVRSVVLLVAEDSLRASLFSAIKLDGRESRKVARLQRVNSATETTKMII
jgi:hypothetical protein